ncbi:MAG: cell division protein FtsZ, partial [Anaerolineaceae bacterium]|nr:cell division protein FtsZ [Anaerolineaceae bacterium]
YEVTEAAAIIKETAHPDVNMIFGAVIDPNMVDEIRITVIATGFDRSGPQHFQDRTKRLENIQTMQRASQPKELDNSRKEVPAEFQPRMINTDDMDVPAFLRKRINR